VEQESGSAALAHDMATRAWRLIYLVLGVPTTALAAVAGASALANYRIVAAVLALAAAVASALMTFLNPSAQVTEHRTASGRYRAIENRARFFWEITCAGDTASESARHELSQLVDEWNQAIDGSPPLFERFRRQALAATTGQACWIVKIAGTPEVVVVRYPSFVGQIHWPA
jgi:hypothetical protein